MVHYMLPDSTKLSNNTNIAKFGDTGIQALYKQVVAAGANPRRLVAKIAGGACMFAATGTTVRNVGSRNIELARLMLKAMHIPLVAEDVGLNYGRTVELNCENGEYTIKAVGKGNKVI
jgi:chemotaxis protein CheD